jgi:hypothetical protein
MLKFVVVIVVLLVVVEFAVIQENVEIDHVQHTKQHEQI